VLETERKVGEELKNRNQELAGKRCFVLFDHAVLSLFFILSLHVADCLHGFS